MNFTLSRDAYDIIHKAHRGYGWTFTKYMKMWDFYHKVHDGARL